MMRKWVLMAIWCLAATVSAQTTYYRIPAESVDSVIQHYVADTLKNTRKEIKKWILNQKVDEADERTYNKIQEKQEALRQGRQRLDSLTAVYNRQNSMPQSDLEDEINRLDNDIQSAQKHIAELQQQISTSLSDLAWAQHYVDTNNEQAQLEDLLEQAKQQMAGTFNWKRNQELASQIENLMQIAPRNSIPRECSTIVKALKNQVEYAKTLRAIKKWLLADAVDNKTVKDDISNEIKLKIRNEKQQDPFPAYYVHMNEVLKRYRNLKTGDEVPEDEF